MDNDDETQCGTLAWWQNEAIYEIAPISFQDSNGDGKGDLKGLISRIDYLEWLGIGAVWLTPIFTSPMHDFGYDIADFCNVDACFGSLADFDELLAQLHQRKIRMILDFVPNHTADCHPWFIESRSSRTNPKRDWYIWADPGPNGGPPNNWISRFGGSAWEWDTQREQYYYHAFLTEQPDLNWRSPEVRNAMADVLRFWLRRGVDGFRVDAGATLSKDVLLRDDPPLTEADKKTPPPQRFKRVFTDDRPEALDYLALIREVVDEFDDRALCGEVQGKIDRIGHFYGREKPRLHMPLNFALLDSPWDALSLQGTIDAYLNAIPKGAWPNWVLGGHDKRRIASKIGQAQMRVIAVLLMSLRGTPIFYAGDELGLEQTPIPVEMIHDPFEIQLPGFGLGRDPERTPMPWDAKPTAGFTSGKPWLPIGEANRNRNVAKMANDPDSLLWLFKRLIELRRRQPALTAGEQIPLRSLNDVLAFRRTFGNDDLLIALNLVHQPRKFEWQGTGQLLLSTCSGTPEGPLDGPILLRPDQGIIVKLRGRS